MSYFFYPSGKKEDMTLDQLKPKQSGLVDSVDPFSQRTRLMELGFVQGSEVTFISSTPFGDPNIYHIRGTAIALRKIDAKHIHLRTAQG